MSASPHTDMNQKCVYGLLALVLGVSIPSIGPYIYRNAVPEIESADTTLIGDLYAEEYYVYKAYIEDRFDYQTIVIMESTFWGVYMVYAMARTEFGASLAEDMPTLDTATYEDFLAKNEESYLLEDSFNLSAQIVLMSEKELVEIFQEGEGWDDFYEKYPSSQGIMNVSRVGFNTTMDQAFFYLGNQSYWLSGSGYYVLLTKKDGIWVIESEVMIWIS